MVSDKGQKNSVQNTLISDGSGIAFANLRVCTLCFGA